MNALKRRNPLTESFLVQLDADFGTLAQKIPELKNAFPRSSDVGSLPFFWALMRGHSQAEEGAYHNDAELIC